MRFAEPDYFYLLLLIPAVIGFWLIMDYNRKRLLLKFGSWELLNKIIERESGRRWLKRVLVLLGIFLIICSLARPQWSAKITKIEQKGLDLIIAIDTSQSMLAQDIKPSRLEKAKYELNKLIELTEQDRIGIVCFAGTAFTLCPLTLDYNAVRLFMDTISTDLIPLPGTCLSDAIMAGLENFNPEEKKSKVILLLTDGEDHCQELGKDPVKSAEEAKRQGAVIYTIGIGSAQGGLIPVKDEAGNLEYKRDQSGEFIFSRLDEETLKKIALATGGKYYYSKAGELEVERIYQEIKQMEKKKFGERVQVVYEERYQYFLGLGMILLFIQALLSERKK